MSLHRRLTIQYPSSNFSTTLSYSKLTSTVDYSTRDGGMPYHWSESVVSTNTTDYLVLLVTKVTFCTIVVRIVNTHEWKAHK